MVEAGIIERLKAERDFLLARAGHAGSCSFRPGRWTGVSSNALVSLAFGGEVDCDALPLDSADLAACYRTLQRLPAHLVTQKVIDQLTRGEQAVGLESCERAREATSWQPITVQASHD